MVDGCMLEWRVHEHVCDKQTFVTFYDATRV